MSHSLFQQRLELGSIPQVSGSGNPIAVDSYELLGALVARATKVQTYVDLSVSVNQIAEKEQSEPRDLGIAFTFGPQVAVSEIARLYNAIGAHIVKYGDLLIGDGTDLGKSIVSAISAHGGVTFKVNSILDGVTVNSESHHKLISSVTLEQYGDVKESDKLTITVYLTGF